MIRKVLVAVRGDGKGDSVFAHAAALARGFNAHIEITTQKNFVVALPNLSWIKERF